MGVKYAGFERFDAGISGPFELIWVLIARYILLRLDTELPAEPLQAGDGASVHSPLIAPRCERPVPAGGDGKRHGCISERSGKLASAGRSWWILLLYVFFSSSLSLAPVLSSNRST